MKQFIEFYKKCKKSDCNFILILIRLIIIKIFYNKILLLHQHVKIKGLKHIESKEKIEVGIAYVGFMHKTDKTYLNINGKLRIKGKYVIGRGCRIDIGKNAEISIGEGGYINANTFLIIAHKLTIGDNCAISWNCQFLDEDFHEISYLGKQKLNNSILIGNNVWIGSGVKIYKGTIIPDGCVVASDSVVKGVFHIKNSLIGGVPAKMIKENIHWK
jgi:acetyltransferase-like isoleucine patch superfamily enzyme